MREFWSGLSRGEVAILVAAAVAVIVWAGVGPPGVVAGVLPALALGLLCGAVIALNRRRRSD
jgi:ribose/xylose/arabinose/galactoside ABC-type transport system permease subunit